MVLVELAAYLVAQGLGSTTSSPPTIYRGFLPPDPDVCIVLYEYGGFPNEPDMGTSNPRMEYPLVQVVTRGAEDDQDGPRLRAQQVVTAFTKIADQPLSGIQYLSVMAKQPVFPLRRDENFRWLFAVNFQVTKDYSAS